MTAVAEIIHRYAPTPAPVADTERFVLQWPVDGVRTGVHVRAQLSRPDRVRDAVLVLGDILASDLRFKAQDRSDYLAYLLAHGKRASKAVWDAQKAFLETQYGEAAQEETPLDPLLTLDATGIAIEVFSRDESTYARLHLKAGTAYQAQDAAFGTTHLAFSAELLQALGRMRSYRRSTVEFIPSATGADKPVRVPYRWLRAFGQVQTASTLPAQRLQLAPIDLYNVLLNLRLHKAKQAPRALRYELVPGQAPRLVLEPWDQVLTASGSAYTGDRPQVVRTWGRQRLTLLARLLPHTKHIEVHLLGPGLPAFYVLDLGDATLTMALSGWTDSGWAGIATFDLLAPNSTDELLEKRIIKLLQERPHTLDELAGALGQTRNEARQALLSGLLDGRLLHDVATGLYHHRQLTAVPLDPAQLRYRDEREEQAHRLLADKEQVQLTRVHDMGSEGTAIEGMVEDRQAHRHYRPVFTLDREGRSSKAQCSCPQFRRAGIKEGPCAHMIALRLLYARQQTELERARGTAAGRKMIHAETRTLVRREGAGALHYRITLDERQVVLRWGRAAETLRMHRLLFDDVDAAREEYFARLEELSGKGYIDASAAERI